MTVRSALLTVVTAEGSTLASTSVENFLQQVLGPYQGESGHVYNREIRQAQTERHSEFAMPRVPHSAQRKTVISFRRQKQHTMNTHVELTVSSDPTLKAALTAVPISPLLAA